MRPRRQGSHGACSVSARLALLVVIRLCKPCPYHVGGTLLTALPCSHQRASRRADRQRIRLQGPKTRRKGKAPPPIEKVLGWVTSRLQASRVLEYTVCPSGARVAYARTHHGQVSPGLDAVFLSTDCRRASRDIRGVSREASLLSPLACSHSFSRIPRIMPAGSVALFKRAPGSGAAPPSASPSQQPYRPPCCPVAHDDRSVVGSTT